MSEAIDTSVVLRLLTGEPAAQRETARRHVEQAASPLHVDALVVGESYFALRHHYGVPHRDAVDALLALLASDRIRTPADVRAALVAARTREQPGLMDRLILGAARAEGRRLVTFDRRLARLEGTQLLR